MLEYPAQPGGPAFRIPGPTDGVMREANAQNSPGNPVCDGVTTEVEQDPSREHGGDGGRGRAYRPRGRQGQTRRCKPGNLQRISGKD